MEEIFDLHDAVKMAELRDKRNNLETILSYLCPQLSGEVKDNKSSLEPKPSTTVEEILLEEEKGDGEPGIHTGD